jgi:exodeoxyribonuclease-5
VALVDRSEWLTAARDALRRSGERDDPDLARILCYTNRSLERLVPMARRALHGASAERLPVLPGEVLITRRAVMAAACRAGEAQEQEPDLVLGSNREVVVQEVASEPCPLAEFGVEQPAAGAGVIDALVATVETAGSRLSLRLLPPLGSPPRQELEEVLQRLAEEARLAPKGAARPLWRRFFLLRDAFASLGPAAVLTVHRSQGSTFAEVFVERDVFWPRDEVLRRQLAYVAVSRASQAVWMVGGPGPATERGHWRDWLSDAPGIPHPPGGEDGAR